MLLNYAIRWKKILSLEQTERSKKLIQYYETRPR